MSALKKYGILPWIIVAIILGLVCGQFFPTGLSRVFYTYNDIFSQFLNFAVPLIIVGLVIPAIGDLGRGAGKWLGLTAAIAYASTIFSGVLTYIVCAWLFPSLLNPGTFSDVKASEESLAAASGYFTIEIAAPFEVMTALVLSFVIGIGLSIMPRGVLRRGFLEFREIITALISRVVIPLLPLHIFGIFLNLTQSGEAAQVISTLLTVVVVLLILEVVILGTQFGVAGAVAKVNPVKALWNMKDAYLTALGTSSSAATIPVTLRQTLKNGVRHPIANFVIPLCATIHLAGSTSKITAFAMAIAFTQNIGLTTGQWIGFIFMLGVVMVAAPGVPGGGIMAAVGILQSMLGFSEQQVALMIATYIALDSFGTATNVTGDGAIALVVDRILGKKLDERDSRKAPSEDYVPFDPDAYIEKIKEG
ncbi:dicarboxylate/amino acid:cation symporter [Rothia amarae]|uniref:Dicarboxylate/amino acid:cation symporter n=1 Tax=Rothia amarae TaxID=169480 RepID=A0A7H2BKS3_9MICC|nr:dicarboxylate/amino acid:cation symporter [Rothia amarae]QNV40269.1 dicarboxylate/amino acid:cation symporter [Rothia amarae]